MADLTAAVQALLDERVLLRSELGYYRSAVDILLMQNSRYAEILQAANTTQEDSVNTTKITDAQWVAGNFLYRPSTDNHLKDAVNAFQVHNSAQRAMALLTLKINVNSLTDAQRIQAQLFLTAIMRASSTTNDNKTLNNALAIANDALETAESIGDYALVAKAHFHRAMCFLHKKQLLEAQFGFAIASYDESYRELAELNRQDVESMIDRRQLT